MAQFLILARDSGQWPEMSPGEIQRVTESYVRWTIERRQSGKLLASNKLFNGEGKLVRGGQGGMVVKDGPYVETKEVVGGYWLVEVPDYEHAVKLCADHPHLRFGTLELRRIEEM
jgi:hypothetical protein